MGIRVKRHVRPRSVTLLAIGVLTIAGINLVRFVQAIAQGDFLSQWLIVSPLYIALSGLIWALICLPLALAMWRGWFWARRFFYLVASGYSLYYWLDRYFFAGDKPLTNWPFCVTVNLILFGIILLVFSRRKVKAFFGEVNEQKSEDSTVT